MRIGVAFSLAPEGRPTDGPDDRFEEFDRPETVEALADAIRSLGHDVRLLGDGPGLIDRLRADRPDFVFNIAEGQGTTRCREAHVPALLEMLGIPYSGSDALTMAATLDKSVAKRLVRGVSPVADEALLTPGQSPESIRQAVQAIFDRFPGGLTVIAKPAFEGSSKGIRGACLADTVDEAVETASRLIADYRQPVLVEEYIAGDEVTVGVLGNGAGARVLGTLRVLPVEPTRQFVYSLEVKRDWKRRVRYEVPASLAEDVLQALHASALAIYETLACRDFARIDFRVRDGVPYFLEANPLPGLSPGTSDLVILADGHGVSHRELVTRVLDAALRRYGLAS